MSTPVATGCDFTYEVWKLLSRQRPKKDVSIGNAQQVGKVFVVHHGALNFAEGFLKKITFHS